MGALGSLPPGIPNTPPRADGHPKHFHKLLVPWLCEGFVVQILWWQAEEACFCSLCSRSIRGFKIQSKQTIAQHKKRDTQQQAQAAESQPLVSRIGLHTVTTQADVALSEDQTGALDSTTGEIQESTHLLDDSGVTFPSAGDLDSPDSPEGSHCADQSSPAQSVFDDDVIPNDIPDELGAAANDGNPSREDAMVNGAESDAHATGGQDEDANAAGGQDEDAQERARLLEDDSGLAPAFREQPPWQLRSKV
ncbi:hypothetical protein SCP_1303640 [Sparassis crispa]|uniref:Uncharacterized protein n=1 Tax=Sparassis crispa TaxID=139825 RepID=A0A401H2B5_9APHY|nr:hypothetical protein SCP_1303640 [Sparassis crispa]GBE88548.1 hypothetical protein SCP_1303640 [Sparassis crispa]